MSELKNLIQTLCPDGVEYRMVGEICYICRGVVMSKDFIRDNAGDYPVYSSQTENNGELGKIATYNFDGEYLTWTTDGANAGSVFYRNGKFSVTNVCGVLEIKAKNVLTKFLYYVLQTAAKPYVNKGMGNAKLMSNVMARVKIPVPPIEVQREIVRILDNFTELIAELTAELTARKKQYEYYRDELLKGEREGVEYYALGKVCDMQAGKAISAFSISSKQTEKCKYPCYGGNGLRGYVEHYNQNGDYPLIGRQGALCGNVQYASGKFYATEHAVVVSHKGIFNTKYLYYLLTAAKLNQYKTAGAQPGLSVAKLNTVIVPVPSLEEQERVVSILDRFDKLCNDLTEGLPAEIEVRKKQYEYYRDKLLTFKHYNG